MSNEDLCYCPACIINRKGFGKAECLSQGKKKKDKDEVKKENDKGQQTRLL